MFSFLQHSKSNAADSNCVLRKRVNIIHTRYGTTEISRQRVETYVLAPTTMIRFSFSQKFFHILSSSLINFFSALDYNRLQLTMKDMIFIL